MNQYHGNRLVEYVWDGYDGIYHYADDGSPYTGDPLALTSAPTGPDAGIPPAPQTETKFVSLIEAYDFVMAQLALGGRKVEIRVTVTTIGP